MTPGRRASAATAALACLAAASAPVPGLATPAAGQTSDPARAALDSVEAAADSGRAASARRALERWMGRRFAEAPQDLRVRARFLQARLAEDPEEARRAYALVALEGGRPGARARLRLAQLHLAEGRHERALEELATVRADVPGTELAARAWLWTGRVREAEGEGAVACEAYRRASEAAPGGEEGLGGAVARAVAACRRGDGTPEYAASDAGGWAVQLGAFSMRASAEEVRSRAAEAGFDARVTERDPGDGLIRVRVGGFDSESAAEEAARRIEEAGFRALVVEIGSSGDDS